MARSTKTARVVTPAEVRAYFTEDTKRIKAVKDSKGNPANPASIVGGKTKGVVRGRVSPLFVQAFLAANPGTTYAEKTKAAPVMVEVPRKGKNGRALKSVSLPISEVRALSGQAKGRLSAASIAKAGAAL